jgi:hypothetical protein
VLAAFFLGDEGASVDRFWPVILFVVALVAAGLPLWLVPYDRIDLPNIWLLPGLLVIVPLAAGTRHWRLAGTAMTVAALTGAMLTANMVRVFYDTGIDPTSHNLWPIELVMTAFAGLAVSLTGCLIGWISSLLWKLLGQP